MEKIQTILKKILPQIAVEHNFANYDFQIEPITSSGANYTTTLYNVTVKEGINTHYMFVKLAAMGEKMRSENPKVYSTEMFVYSKLMKIYEAMENEHNVPQEHRLEFTKFYGCHPTKYEETVVLEDLVKKGYQAYDRSKSYNWEYASSAMTELAKLHALSFAYNEYYPEQFKKVLNDFKFDLEYGVEVYEQVLPILNGAIDAVHEEAKDKVRNYLYSLESNGHALYLRDYYRTPVLGHKDFRPSNLMHRTRDDGKVDIKIVDFQTMQGSSPVLDIISFIFLGSDGKFREQYYEKLLDHYYTELQAAMRRLDLDPEKVYSRADFDYELKKKLPHALVLAVFGLPIVTVAPEDALKLGEDFDNIDITLSKTNDRYAELLNDVVNDFIRWGII